MIFHTSLVLIDLVPTPSPRSLTLTLIKPLTPSIPPIEFHIICVLFLSVTLYTGFSSV